MNIELITAEHIEVIETHRANMIEYMNGKNLSQRVRERIFAEIIETSHWLNNFRAL